MLLVYDLAGERDAVLVVVLLRRRHLCALRSASARPLDQRRPASDGMRLRNSF
jgi:hypothetical protein